MALAATAKLLHADWRTRRLHRRWRHWPRWLADRLRRVAIRRLRRVARRLGLTRLLRLRLEIGGNRFAILGQRQQRLALERITLQVGGMAQHNGLFFPCSGVGHGSAPWLLSSRVSLPRQHPVRTGDARLPPPLHC